MNLMCFLIILLFFQLLLAAALTAGPVSSDCSFLTGSG